MYNKCIYCNYCKESYKTVLKHQTKCIFKPTFLDTYYDKVISTNILKEEHPDVKYIADKQFITQSYSHLSYGNKLHIEIYKDENLEGKQIDFDILFINQNHKMKGIQIEIENIKTYEDKYTIELLESNLQNKNKINKLWDTIKYRFVDNLLILCRVLSLIIDLPDEIDTIVYSQWLLDNGLNFEYKFGDKELKIKNDLKNNKEKEELIKDNQVELKNSFDPLHRLPSDPKMAMPYIALNYKPQNITLTTDDFYIKDVNYDK